MRATGTTVRPPLTAAYSLRPWLLFAYGAVAAVALSLPWALARWTPEAALFPEPANRAGSSVPAPLATESSRPDRAEMSLIPSGSYRPFYKSKSGEQPIPVRAFLLDRAPVSHDAFLEFVHDLPNWRRSQVKRLFAEASYLADWRADLDLGEAPTRAAQTFVSWFAAKAYCAYRGKRLPTLVEWEHAAAMEEPASAQAGDPRAPFRFAMGRVNTTAKDQRPSFGSIWEWTLDFNGSLVSGRASPEEDAISSLFCGAGARAVDAADYGAFLRYSFRSSLKAGYALKNLGFRCARDLK